MEFINKNIGNAKADKDRKLAVVEFYSMKNDQRDLTYLSMSMDATRFKMFTKGMSKILDKDLKSESIDIRSDVRIMAESFPFKAVARVGGEL